MTDWLDNRLDVAGATRDVDAFLAAAAGPGVTPWEVDLDAMEERWFNMLAAPPPPQRRTMPVADCHGLARALRESAAANHEADSARMATSRRCALDLHRLLPVPPGLLGAGETDPRSQDWMRTTWGVTSQLRHAEVAGRRRAAGSTKATVAFFSADWTPWAAVVALRLAWPQVTFVARPRYGGR